MASHHVPSCSAFNDSADLLVLSKQFFWSANESHNTSMCNLCLLCVCKGGHTLMSSAWKPLAPLQAHHVGHFDETLIV